MAKEQLMQGLRWEVRGPIQKYQCEKEMGRLESDLLGSGAAEVPHSCSGGPNPSMCDIYLPLWVGC